MKNYGTIFFIKYLGKYFNKESYKLKLLNFKLLNKFYLKYFMDITKQEIKNYFKLSIHKKKVFQILVLNFEEIL